jgi:hypothetical protein
MHIKIYPKKKPNNRQLWLDDLELLRRIDLYEPEWKTFIEVFVELHKTVEYEAEGN